MTLVSPFIVRIENPPSFGETMNEIRAWLDHRKIQPALFRVADIGVGFEIGFSREDEAVVFEREFAALIRRASV